MNNKDFWEAVRELSPKLFMTYSVIYKLSDNEVGYCYAGNKAISEKIEKSTRRISGDLAELKKLGYLNIIEINKKGNYCEERRIYTNNNYKTFSEDLKNLKNLIKTTTKTIDDVLYFYNERNPMETKPNRGIDKNVHRGIDKNVHVTNTNTNLSKITTTGKDEKPSSSLLVNIFKKHNFKISELNIKNIEKLNIQKSVIEEYLKYTISQKKGVGYLIKALKENWDITPQNKKEVKKIKAAGIDYNSKITKSLGECSDFELQKNRLLALLSLKLKREDLVIEAKSIKNIKELNKFYISNSLKI